MWQESTTAPPAADGSPVDAGDGDGGSGSSSRLPIPATVTWLRSGELAKTVARAERSAALNDEVGLRFLVCWRVGVLFSHPAPGVCRHALAWIACT